MAFLHGTTLEMPEGQCSLAPGVLQAERDAEANALAAELQR